MPTYEYLCSACGYREEVFQRITEEPLVVCPNCKEASFARLVTGGAGVIYKGEGWYVTDYSKKSSGGKEQPPPPTPAPEHKAPTSKPGGAEVT